MNLPAPDRCIIDNSVWQRMGNPIVAAAVQSLTLAGLRIVTCAPQLLEYLWSARNPQEYERLRSVIGAFPKVEPGADFATVCVNLQRALWHEGLVRAVGNADVQITAIALQNNCMVVHYDNDFRHLQQIEPALRQRAIVPIGTL